MSGLSLPDDFTGRDPAPQGHGGGGGGAQAIRCPACRREHLYEPPSLPCPCGASLKVPLLRGGVPVQVRFRSWEDSWLSMRCPHCGRSDQWPQPEFTCNCGATVRLPVDRATRLPGAAGTGPQGTRPQDARPYSAPVPAPPAIPQVPPQGHWQQRAPFHPQPVHTSQDAVFTAARYLEWLGFDDLELTEAQERDGVTLLGRLMVAQVDVWTEPHGREVRRVPLAADPARGGDGGGHVHHGRVLPPGDGPWRAAAGGPVQPGPGGCPAARERRGGVADGNRLDLLTRARRRDPRAPSDVCGAGIAAAGRSKSMTLVIWCTSSPPC